MKYKNLIIYVITVLVILGGSFLVYHFMFKEKDNFSNLISLSVNDLKEKSDKKEKFILVITQTGCSHCEQYLPELNRTLKEVNLNAYTLNITGLTNEDASLLNKYATYLGTPTTIFFDNGEETTTLNRIVGYASSEKIKDRLKSLGYIN